MNKTKFCYIVIGLLVLSNMILAFFFFENRSKQFHPDKPRNTVIERLRFDENQVKQYDVFIQNHREKTREIGRQIRELKKQLYSNLPKPQNDSLNLKLISAINEKQKELELVHYNHFLEIKSICTPSQWPLYEKLTNDLIEIFPMGNKPHPNRPPRR